MMAELIRKYGACVDCGEADPAKLTGDHIVSIHQGGQNVMENLTLLCRACNGRKGRLIDRADRREKQERNKDAAQSPA